MGSPESKPLGPLKAVEAVDVATWVRKFAPYCTGCKEFDAQAFEASEPKLNALLAVPTVVGDCKLNALLAVPTVVGDCCVDPHSLEEPMEHVNVNAQDPLKGPESDGDRELQHVVLMYKGSTVRSPSSTLA